MNSGELGEHIEPASLEGWIAPLDDDSAIRAAVEKAFDYRGDVTVTLKDGRSIAGYIFDRRGEDPSLAHCQFRVMPADGGETLVVHYSDLCGIGFTGKDTAAGKSFETWVKKMKRDA